eukprot:s269_g11.t1
MASFFLEQMRREHLLPDTVSINTAAVVVVVVVPVPVLVLVLVLVLVVANIQTYTVVIGACGRASFWETALALFAEVRPSDVDLFALSAAIVACTQRWEVACALLGSAGSFSLAPDTQRRFERQGLRLFWDMIEGSLCPDSATFNAAVTACEQGGQWQRLLRLLTEMDLRNVAKEGLEVVTYTSAISACAKASATDQAAELLQRMEAEQLLPNVVPQVQIVDKDIEVPVPVHRHVPLVQKVQKHVEVPVVETLEKVIEVPVINQVDIPQIQTVEKRVEVPIVQNVQKVVEIPVVGDTVQGEQQRTAVELPPLRQEASPEIATEVVQGPPMPTEYVQGLVTQSDSVPPQPMSAQTMPLSSRALSPQPLATAPLSMSPMSLGAPSSSGVPSVTRLPPAVGPLGGLGTGAWANSPSVVTACNSPRQCMTPVI